VVEFRGVSKLYGVGAKGLDDGTFSVLGGALKKQVGQTG